MIDQQTARSLVQAYVEKAEQQLNRWGCKLPGYADRPKFHLVILDELTQTHDFGWVFFYDSQEHINGDRGAVLAGNAPLIVDKTDGGLYVTGTAHEIEHYVAEHRRGRRHPAER